MSKSSTATRGRKSSGSSSTKTAGKRSGNRTQTSRAQGSSTRSTDNRSSARSNQKSSSLSSTGMKGNRQSGMGKSSRQGSAGGEGYLEKFFTDQLKDIYYAEQKLVQALGTMRDAATTEELQDAFEDHMHVTERHCRRLEKVFESLGMRPEGKQCEAIEGIIREVESIIDETEEGSMTRDAALIMGAQKAEHYEIASYGGLVTFAITMGLYDEADLLDRTLIEEEMTDSMLTDIAENFINLEAEQEGGEFGGEEEEMEMGTEQQGKESNENEESEVEERHSVDVH